MSYTQDLLNLAMEANGIVAGITANTTAISSISVGNSTVNSTINSTAFSISGSAINGVNTSTQYVFSNTISFGNSTVNTTINSTSINTTSNTATFGTAAYIIANGNVGIQTSLPDAHFHISSGSAKVRIGLTTSNQYIDISRDSPTGFTIYNAAQASPYAGHIWQVTSTEYMRITSNGNVGIGNSAPGSKLTISGGVSSFEALLEKATVSATAATGTVHLDALTQAVLYYTSNATANFTLNVRANSSVTANSILVNGQSLTVAFLNTTGATAYYPNVFSIDSTTVVPKYSGGTAYTAGNANSVDSYTFTIIKTANSTYTVLANQTQYK